MIYVEGSYRINLKQFIILRSVLCYENVLKLKPDLKMAIRKMHGIQCLSKLEKALETQHKLAHISHEEAVLHFLYEHEFCFLAFYSIH